MTKKSFSIKSFLLIVILALSFVFMQNAWFFAGIIGSGTQLRADVDTTTDAISSTDVTSNLSNNTFANGNGSFPQTPTSWNVWDENTKIVPEKSGLIDLSDRAYANNYSAYGLTGFKKPVASNNGTENYVLMINSGNRGDTSVRYNYGYANETDISLEANSFYSISTLVYTSYDTNRDGTVASSAYASVYLTGTDVEDLPESTITRINTQGGWQNVTFYIATGTDSNTSVGLELFLGEKSTLGGSAGYVLFDNITITRYSGDAFQNVLNASPYSSFVDLRPDYLASGDGFVTNGDFATNIDTGWTQEASSSGNTQYVTDFNKQLEINDENVLIGNNQRGDNRGVVVSANSGYNAIKSDDIEIKQHGLYRITFWAKGNLESGNANFVVSGYLPEQTVLPDEENPEGVLQSQTISALATNAIALNNNWAMYAFYIEGNPLFDCTINLTLGVGTESASATGYVAVAGVRSEKITTEQQTSATENNSNSATLSMNNFGALSFVNGAFNLVDINEENTTYPLTPKNWTQTNENASGSGVVNLLPETWNNSNLGIVRPAKDDGDFSDNVLMVRNDTANYQGYTSESVNLAADGYALITVDVFTRSISQNGYAYVTIKNANDVVIHQIKLRSTNSWQTYQIYIHNYYVAQDLTATLSLGDEAQTASGVAFFDNCIINTSITEETFNGIEAGNNTFVVDLATNSLTASDGITPTYWTGHIGADFDAENIDSGLIDVRNYEQYFAGNPTAPTEDNNKVLFISASSPSYYYYSSNLTYTFTSGTYYKVSVLVRTINVPENIEGQYDDSGNPYLNGASISIDGIDSSFTGIRTSQSDKNKTLEQMFDDTTNTWQEYIMYINTTSDVNGVIRLGLGTQTMPTTGYAFFANLSVTSMTEDEYNSETATLDPEDLPSNIVLATNTPTDEEDTPTTYSPFDWFAIPTVIIAVAVIVAVVGYYIKRFYQNHPRKATVSVGSDYDRLQTLLKDVDRRERKTAIKHKIDLLHEELKQSQEFLQQEQAEFNKKMQAYNTAKEIAQDNPNVQLELPDEKQIQKSIKIQEDKIEQIETDIRILEDEYERINSQIKKDNKKEKTIQIKKRK